MFALGHALPVVAVGGAAGNLGRFFARLQIREATSIVGGALMLAMGLYYAVLA
jgi:cytochrome c biogenesis protein CcdA